MKLPFEIIVKLIQVGFVIEFTPTRIILKKGFRNKSYRIICSLYCDIHDRMSVLKAIDLIKELADGVKNV